MTTLWDFVADSLETDSADVIGVGASQDEYHNQWLYRAEKGLEDAGMNVSKYWLGFENDPARDYDIKGDVFLQDFENEKLASEASLLVAPTPSIYRGATEDFTYFSNYIEMADLVDTELDMVVMTEVDRDLEYNVLLTDKRGVSENFGPMMENKRFPVEDLNARDLADIINMNGAKATHIQRENGEDIILAQPRR